MGSSRRLKSMVEYLLGVFWILSYLFVVYGGFKYRHEKLFFMPIVAGALNFAWEIHALRMSGGYWVHIIWLALDCFILLQNIYFLSSLKKRIVYCVAEIMLIILLFFIFSIKSFDGMLISSFVIDIIMACEYLFVIKKLSPRYLLIIGVFRLLGDCFAWIGNMRFSVFVTIAGAIVLLVNIIYVSFAFKILYIKKQKRGKRAS